MQRTECPDYPDMSRAARCALEAQEAVFSDIMNQLRINIYVSEVGTGKILFMNKMMKRAFDVEHPEGFRCWEILQKGVEERCPGCPIPQLGDGRNRNAQLTWEAYNTKNNRVYKHCANLIQRSDGTWVNVCHSLDVTENRELTRAAAYDDLTGVLNRRAGKATFQKKLDGGRPFALCMLDVNDLKGTNDAHGHQAGDALLVKVAHAVRDQMRPTDCLFRLSGDEFVALMDDTDRAGANHRMKLAIHALRERPDDPDKFCFGISTAAPEGRNTLSSLLADADSELYTRKRQLHILRAEEHLQVHPEVVEDPATFTYDQDLLYDAILQSTDDYLYVCNMKTGVFRYSQAMVDEFDLPGQVIENAAAVWGAKVHEDDKTAFLAANQDIIDGHSCYHYVEYRAQNRKGEWLWMRCRGHLERDESGAPALFAGFITNLGKKNRFDHLTGLSNRLAFEEECVCLLQAGPLVLMLFDIDNLARINRRYDRAFGDEVIRIISQRIQSLLPPNAQVFRLDGAEFGVLIRGNAPDAAQALYHSIRDTFSTQQTWENKKFFCTLTCGCALAPGDGTDYPEFLRRAHCALDYGKWNGKDRLAFFTDGLMDRVGQELEFVEPLGKGIE